VIEQVHSSLMDLLPYEQTSLVLAQNCSSVSGDSPLFNALLNYRHSELAADDGSVSEREGAGVHMLFGQERTNYPFNLAIDDWGEGFSLTVKVDKAADAADVLGYIQTALANLVEALSETPSRAIDTLSVLSDRDRNQLLVEWNETAANYPRDKCIHELFEAHAENSPAAIAVIFENQQLTYRQLNEKANQLAHFLVNEKQVMPDTLVGIYVERSLEMVIAILAILKAGGAYVPLDPEYPAARLTYMLEDANLNTVLTQTHLRETTRVSNADVLCLDDELLQQDLQRQPLQNLSIEALALTPRNLAYVIYTSGSTGKPKGVMIEHASLVNYVNSFAEYCENVSGSFVNTNICFDGTATSFWLPFAFGKYVKLSTSSSANSLSELIDEVSNACEPMLFKITPAHLDALFHAENNTKKGIRHNVFVGGELFSTQKYKSLPEWFKSSNIFNHYGPSEATVGCAFFPIEQSAIASLHSVPLGRPINNTTLFVFNSNDKLCPVGVAGELHIGGLGLARGYLNRSALTNEKFISNPFYDKNNSSSSKHLYKTGDLVRWLPDGNLEFLDRIDNQVKIRGFRIELGEIENVLMGFGDVKKAVVLAKDNHAGDKYLAAYVVPDSAENVYENNKKRSVFIERMRQRLNFGFLTFNS